MIISIDERFQSLFNGLKSMGYEVYSLSDNINSEAVIYSGGDTHITSLNLSLPGSDDGVFLINGDNRSTAEIDNMIRNRAYSSLF